MTNFEVSSDSTCDLYAQEIKDMNIHFVPLCFTMDKNGDFNEYYDNFTDYQQYVD